MNEDVEVVAVLKRIEANQLEALKLQKEQLELARAQLERSGQSIQESLQLQRTAVARQSQLTKVLLPIVGILLLLLVYLLVRWNIL